MSEFWRGIGALVVWTVREFWVGWLLLMLIFGAATGLDLLLRSTGSKVW